MTRARSEDHTTPTLLEKAFTGLRILLVDDVLDTLESMTMLLVLEGADVLASHTGERALSLARRNRIDVLLCKRSLPDMGGGELLRAIRAIEGNDATIAIALLDVDSARDEGATHGDFAFALTTSDLLEALSRIVARLRAPNRLTV